jgi:2-hydroxy-6-oxonona-2,4-dienedioate hydrolase
VSPAETLYTKDGAIPDPLVETFGKGQDVVFMHGLLGINDHWKEVVEHLEHRCRCVLIELPLLHLRGSSCTVEGATQMAYKTIQQHCNAPAVLVGNSLGGHMAMRMALEYPQDIRGLVLAGSSGLFERTFEKDVQHRPSHDWIERKVRDLFADPDKAPTEAIEGAYEKLSQRPAARALVRLSKSAKTDHMGERMRTITQPTLLLWGKQDIVTPSPVAEEFHSLLPNSTLHWLESCGHAPMLEQPAAFAQGLLKFLDDLDTQTSNVESRQEVA